MSENLSLCWKCKEKYEEMWRTGPNLPWVHCHHIPKENEGCWCKYSRQEKKTPHSMLRGDFNFCYTCGRKV